MRCIPLLLLATFGSGLAIASEKQPVDLRLAVMLTPKTERLDNTYHFADGSGARVESDRLNPGYRVEIGLVTRLADLGPSVALVGGGWVFYGEQEHGSVAEGDLGIMRGPRSYLVMGVDFYVALRMQFNRYVGMELGPVVGVGTTRFSDRMTNEAGGAEETGHGEYQEAGANVQFLLRNASRSLLVGLGVRYLVSYGEADNRFAGMQQDVEVSQHGFAPFITVGTTF